MAGRMQFTIGVDATCTDGPCGRVSRVVVDPVARTLTHLMVEPEHRSGLGKLVPLDLVDATSDEVRLHCTRAEFEQLDDGEETQFIPGSNGGYGGYGLGQAVAWPYFSRSSLGIGLGGMRDQYDPVVRETVPLGEVTVRRGEPVHATDGEIGRVQGLVIDPHSRHVTHVLLAEGHLWGSKEVAVPIGSVTRMDEGLTLSLTKRDVEDLPAIDIDHTDE
jgi:sporulation protein YlmC with PRC-barrel domain